MKLLRTEKSMEEEKILFIWPPLIKPHWLPLGIPFLVSYLRSHGVNHIEVFDMNMAYLKEIQPFWSLYMTMKRGACHYKRKILSEGMQESPEGAVKKKEHFLEPLVWSLYNYLHNRKIALIDSLGSHASFIPWSLNSILASFSANQFVEVRKNVGRILPSLMPDGNYPLVCISAGYPEQLFFALLAAQELKEKSGHAVRIIMGGSQVTKHIHQLSRSQQVHDAVDFLVYGDGEEPLWNLLRALREKRGFSEVPNLYYKDPDHREGYVKSKKAFFLEPNDFPIPDFSGFQLEDYQDVIPLIITKGCFWNRCSFCSYSSMQDRRFCNGSVEKAISIIQELMKRYDTNQFFFVDDALPPKFMEALAGELLRQKMDIVWSSNIILDRLFMDRNLTQLLRRSGLDTVNIGLESISPRILRLMNKYHQNIGESEIKNILESLKSTGIEIQLNIIFGFPAETPDEARHTLKFLLENSALYDYCAAQPFCLEDNTLISEKPEKFGIVKIYKEDKNAGRRLGYNFDVKEGMSQKEAMEFTYGEAQKLLKESSKKKTRCRKSLF